MLDYEKTGQLIQQRRRELNITQKELAERLDVTDRAVSKWETGKSFPDVAMLKPLAEALGVSVGELLDGQLRESDVAISAEEAGETAIRGIRVYARQNLRRYRMLVGILAVSILLLAAVGIYEYLEYAHRPLNFQEDDLTFGDLIFQEEDGTEYRWELDDAFGLELREQIIYYLKKEAPQGTSVYGKYWKLNTAKERAWLELENLLIIYDEGYYDFRSDDFYTYPSFSMDYRILTDLCREVVLDEIYEYDGETYFQDGEQILEIDCELTEARMARIAEYYAEKVMEPENVAHPDAWIDYRITDIRRMAPEEYQSYEEFHWIEKEYIYRECSSWRIYDVTVETKYTDAMIGFVPQYPDGTSHWMVMVGGSINGDWEVYDEYTVRFFPK